MFCLFYGEVKEEKVAVAATKDFSEMQCSPTDCFKLGNWIQCSLKWNISSGLCCVELTTWFLLVGRISVCCSEVHVCILRIYVQMSICDWSVTSDSCVWTEPRGITQYISLFVLLYADLFYYYLIIFTVRKHLYKIAEKVQAAHYTGHYLFFYGHFNSKIKWNISNYW